MELLCKQIGMPEDVTKTLLGYHRDPSFQPDCSGLRQEERWQEALQQLRKDLGDDPQELKLLCCMLRCALDAREEYQALGLSEEIYTATFSCFSRFVREHRESFGCYGFDRGFWTVRQVSCRLFRIGEMEFELTEVEGRKVISLHIPSDARLDGLLESWEAARPILYDRFPEYRDAPLFCRSWLLSPELARLLPETSRILAFQRHFQIQPLPVSTTSYVRWVYKDPRLTPDQYPEHTTLQRNLKAWIQQGNVLSDAKGFLIPEDLAPLQILWDYLSLHQEPQRADVIVGFGCYDDSVARRAAQLYHQGFAPKILFTGGLGRNTTGLFTTSEAEKFAAVAMSLGVPEADILLEDKSTNTKENIEFTRALLESRDIPHRRILGVHKPYMERRIQAAMGVYWPEQPFQVTSFRQNLPEALDDALRQGLTRHNTISTIVGDFQRIERYAQKGYQLPQFIPQEAWDAYHTLVKMGYTAHLIP